MKILPLFPALVLAGSVSAFADTHTDNKTFFSDMLQMDRERHSVLNTPDFARGPALSGPDSEFVAALKQQQQQAKVDDNAPVAMMFVSFSIPEDELRSRVNDAADLGVTVSLRGMVNGDMRQTGTRVANLVKETNKGGMQIDPVSFRRYGVTSVPTLIVKCGKASDRVLGDITLRDALKKVAEEGECAEFADSVLNREVSHG
ncbi:type-F conjugative transfer system pilin assembly protein TrbC [Kosakonia sacchari]|uniref:type-F conjugative transfer system pilin assembly protein TrbC n=1 Tax=Kosakonia sacchari TaxID=1158459 RepID=UPI002ACDC577|nr:type-F conjugative transfer system pilin assembly protein TrbC [Kosakonia sacchari]MDZ7324880.1 type-F conjugative transfer system pilin assembly protein TrbC [Kosakonia sacchari]